MKSSGSVPLSRLPRDQAGSELYNSNQALPREAFEIANTLRNESTPTDIFNWEKHPRRAGLGRFVQRIIDFNLERQCARPGHSIDNFWRPLVQRYFAPNANLHIELKSRERNLSVPVKTSAEALPHLWQSMFDAGVSEERILLENPCEHIKADGTIIVTCPKTVIITTYEKSTVLTNGHLIVTFQGSEKIAFWKFTSLAHEELFTPDVISAWDAPQFASSEYGIPTSVCHILTIADSVHHLDQKIGEQIARIVNDPNQMARFQEYMNSVERFAQKQPDGPQNRSSLYSHHVQQYNQLELAQRFAEMQQGRSYQNIPTWNQQGQQHLFRKQAPDNSNYYRRQQHADPSHLQQAFHSVQQPSSCHGLQTARARLHHPQNLQQVSVSQLGYSHLVGSHSQPFDRQMPFPNRQKESASQHPLASQHKQDGRIESDLQKEQNLVDLQKKAQQVQNRQQPQRLPLSQPLAPETHLVKQGVNSELSQTPKAKKQRQPSPRVSQSQMHNHSLKQHEHPQQNLIENLKRQKRQYTEDIQTGTDDPNTISKRKQNQNQERISEQTARQSDPTEQQCKNDAEGHLQSSPTALVEGKPSLSKQELSSNLTNACLTQARGTLPPQPEPRSLFEIQQQLSLVGSQVHTFQHSKGLEASVAASSKLLSQDASGGNVYCAMLSQLARGGEAPATNAMSTERGRTSGFSGLQDEFSMDVKDAILSHGKELCHMPNDVQRWDEQPSGDIFNNFLEVPNQVKLPGNDDGMTRQRDVSDPNNLILGQSSGGGTGQSAIHSRGQAIIEAVVAAASGKDGWGMSEATGVHSRSVKNGKGDVSEPNLQLLTTMTQGNVVGENASISSGIAKQNAPPGLSEFRPQIDDAEASRKSHSQYQKVVTVSSDGIGQSGGTDMNQISELQLQRLISNQPGGDTTQGSGRQSERSVSGNTGMAATHGQRQGEGSETRKDGKNSSSSDAVELTTTPHSGQRRGIQRKSRGGGSGGREKRQKLSNTNRR